MKPKFHWNVVGLSKEQISGLEEKFTDDINYKDDLLKSSQHYYVETYDTITITGFVTDRNDEKIADFSCDTLNKFATNYEVRHKV